MMDFPNNPTVGQIFQGYTWDGVAWTLQPQTKTARAKNLLINPAMQISQENGTAASAAGASGSYFLADQWLGRWSASGASLSCGSNAFIAGGPVSPQCASLLTGTAKASLAAGDFMLLTQTIEGQILQSDLKWGTANAIPAVLAFWARHTTAGKYSCSIMNGAADRSFVSQFDLAAATWKRIIVPIPAKTDGTWPSDNSKGAMLDFCNGVGTTYIGTTGWQNGSIYAGPGQTNGMAVGSTGLLISDVGLYPDPDNTGLPPDFEIPDPIKERDRCQRYWNRLNGLYLSGWNNASNNIYESYPLSTSMRATPVTNFANLANIVNASTLIPGGIITPSTLTAAVLAVTAGSASLITFDMTASARM